MELMQSENGLGQSSALKIQLIEFTEKGQVVPLGSSEFRLVPRIGEKISKRTPEGETNIYEVVDVHYTDNHVADTAEVYVSHVGDLHDYLAGLRWKMKSLR